MERLGTRLFNRVELISLICIILQHVFISESPPKNFYSYLNNRLIVQELDIYYSHFTEQFYCESRLTEVENYHNSRHQNQAFHFSHEQILANYG